MNWFLLLPGSTSSSTSSLSASGTGASRNILKAGSSGKRVFIKIHLIELFITKSHYKIHLKESFHKTYFKVQVKESLLNSLQVHVNKSLQNSLQNSYKRDLQLKQICKHKYIGL